MRRTTNSWLSTIARLRLKSGTAVQKRRCQRIRQTRLRKLHCEELESRELLSASPIMLDLPGEYVSGNYILKSTTDLGLIDDEVALGGGAGSGGEPATGLVFSFTTVGRLAEMVAGTHGTAQQQLGQQVVAGFNAAAGLWSAILNDPVTVSIEIDYAPLGDEILGSTDTSMVGLSYAGTRQLLMADRSSNNDLTAFQQLGAGTFFQFITNDTSFDNGTNQSPLIRDNDQSENNRVLSISKANAKALGAAGIPNGADAQIEFTDFSDFSATASWDFDRSNGIGSTSIDFVATAAHEIGHALGFLSGVDAVDARSSPLGPDNPEDLDDFWVFGVLDLYRYTAHSRAQANQPVGGLRDLAFGRRSATDIPYFSINGGATNLGRFSTGFFNSPAGEEYQASHWREGVGLGLMDPAQGTGELGTLSNLDAIAMDVIGWNRVPPTILDVQLSGSNWPSSPGRDPISFRNDELLGLALTGSGSQIMPIPVQGINTIEIEFSEGISGLTQNSLRIYTSGGFISPNGFNPNPDSNPNTHIARWTLSQPLTTGYYAISLNRDGEITNAGGTILDGEWINPLSANSAPGTSSTFASGNGRGGGAFFFNFSVLPGDYNRNFAGDTADVTIWSDYRDSETVLWADGNGNGKIDDEEELPGQSDWRVWKLSHGAMLPGDFNGSGAVDHLDHNIWKSQFGTTVLEGTGADANFDEVVDIDDYLIWRANEGYQNPWLGDGEIGEPSLVIDEDGAPYVTGVTVAGSNSAHADYDFAGAVGSGQQLKTVPLGGLDTVRITFNEDVFVESSDLTLIGMQGQTIPAVDSFSYDLETCTATWVFASVLPAAQYLIRLSDDIHDIWENQLDGEFENPWALADAAGTSDTFPSGDGVAGGEFRFRFTNLPSDYDHTNIVSLNDLSTLAVNNNLTPATHQQGDGSGDGLVQSANGTPDKLLMDAEWAKNYTVWPSYEPGLIRVTTLSDESDGNYAAGDLSLREALAIAYSQSGHDTIVFAQSLFTSGPATMTLTYDGADAGTAADQLIVDSSVSVVGPGQELLTLNGNNQNRLFWVQSGHSASISGMSMVNGNPSSSGGAIFNSGNLSLDRVTIADNVGAYGGGIYNHGTIRVLNSTISDNTATNVGGGLMSHADTALAVVVENSAIIGNEAPIGGGLYLHVWSAGSGGRSARITNSTVSGNNATTDGGGVAVIGGTTLTVVQSTITDNHAKAGGSVGKGGGIYAINSMTKLQNSIVADNTAEHAYSEDIFANWTIDGTSSNNLIGSDGNSALVNGTNGNIVGSWLAPISPGLSVLGDYGGATLTHRLLSTSSAIDAGSNAAAADYLGNPLASDQRGYTRLFDVPGVNGSGAKVDIGAFEYSTAQVTNITLSSTTTNSYGTNPPYSFATAVGSEEQIRTVPVGNANRIAIQFSKDVDVSSSDLEIIALNRVVTEPTPTLIEGPSSGNGYTATWSLSSVLPDAQYLIRLSDSIVDLDGSALDGEWVNAGSILSSVATSIFPSGDNVAGGDFEFVFTYLRGDANRDLQVTGADLAILSAHLNQGGNKSWANGDFTGDGTVSGSDFGLQTATLNKSDWRNLQILGDYDSNFDLDEDDETAFLDFFNASNISADLNKDSVVNTADYDAFYELYDFEPSLAVLT